MEFSHYSVMLKETIEELKVKSDGIYVDGTLGGGGHAYEVCKRLSDAGHFYGIDQDAAAIAAASQRLSEFGNRVTIIRSNYCEMCKELRDRGVTGVDGIVLDLGVSSYQLDEADRGFTYREDAALDMRMDQRQEKTARDIVNGYSEMDLYRIIRDYGEDKFAKNIAKHIVQARERQPIETTGDYQGGDPGKDPHAERTSGKADLSGYPDRTEPGAGSASGFPGRYDRFPESGRKTLYHHLPFTGRPDRKECISQK